jgi:hypothetical protein
MIGGHTCCGQDSPQEECKGLEIIKDFGNSGNSIEIGEKNSIEEGDSSVESGGTSMIFMSNTLNISITFFMASFTKNVGYLT